MKKGDTSRSKDGRGKNEKMVKDKRFWLIVYRLWEMEEIDTVRL